MRRLARDAGGAALVEFALVVGPLMLVVLALFDLGYRSYVQAQLEGTLHRAARMATTGEASGTAIDAFVKAQLAIFDKDDGLAITKRSYAQFSGVAKEEGYVDADGDGRYDAGECYVDANRNGRWDPAASAGASGLGGADDIVFYTVSLSFSRMFPLGRMLGWSAVETVSANTVLRNQPYAAQAALPTCAA